MKTLFYQLYFKNRDESPLKISNEGYEELRKILTQQMPPLFVTIKGRLIARSEIAQIVPVESKDGVYIR